MSDAVLESGWTDWQKRVLYSTYDVTHLIATGGQPNVLGTSVSQSDATATHHVTTCRHGSLPG